MKTSHFVLRPAGINDLDAIERFVRGERRREQARFGRESNEGQQCEPRERNRRVAGQRPIQPGAGGLMVGRVAVDGIEQNVGVDQLHDAKLMIRCACAG